MTDPAQIQRLHEVAEAGDKAELTVLHNAVIERMRAYQSGSTAANLKNWQAAKTALAETVVRLWPRYFPAEPAEVTVFAQQKDARQWLLKNGFKVSAGKFSGDCREGKCLTQRDKTIRLQDLKAYASSLSVDLSRSESDSDLTRQKAVLEIRRLEQQIEKSEIENRKDDRLWILRETATDHAAALIVQLRSSLRHHFGLKTPSVILASAGEPARAVEVEAALQETIAAAFNELASTREALILGLVDSVTDDEDQ
jgi:hypothetical protein